ncbi:MAG: tRNA (adenosine(37)-N6)-threonylcarbamoyltransferase complex transferase subunit TsaD [Patescibacteria group bacterium]
MRILAIETSCDETALALLEATGGLKTPKFKVLKNLVSSQIETHRPWGGVVPNLAKREHIKNLPLVFRELLDSQTKKFKPDLLAVTVGPGLEPALWTGIQFAKEIHKTRFPKVPLVGVNHLEGHLYSFLLPKTIGERIYKTKGLTSIFPAIALIVSGGHTILLRMDSLTKWKKLGETRDDAAGEAFDKVAKMMRLPYPGGPEISRLAKTGDRHAIEFPRPMIHDHSPAGKYDFSFSGLKTAVLYFLNTHKELLTEKTRSRGPASRLPLVPHPRSSRQNAGHPARSDSDTLFVPSTPSGIAHEKRFFSPSDIAASFEEAAVEVLATKAIRAAKKFGAKSVLLSGGVAANTHLRSMFGRETKKIGAHFLVSPIAFNTDNATMIAAAAYIRHLRKKNRPLHANGGMTI